MNEIRKIIDKNFNFFIILCFPENMNKCEKQNFI